jgi:hypothetical protein
MSPRAIGRGDSHSLLWKYLCVLLLAMASAGCGIDPEVYRREVECRRAAENRAAAAESRARIAEERAAEAERRLVFADKSWFHVAVVAALLVAIEGVIIAYQRGKADKESAVRPLLMELLRQQQAALPGPRRSQIARRTHPPKPGCSEARLPWTN